MSEIIGMFATRSQGARRARRDNLKYFRTLRVGNQGYRLVTMPENPAVDAALAFAETVDFVSHVEVNYIDEGRKPGTKVVLVVTCRKEEIDAGEVPEGIDLEPITDSLWSGDKDDFEHRARRSTSTAAGPRAKSDVESPTKLVWKIADEMCPNVADLTKELRSSIIDRCVEAGVNKATAQTQIYRWAKSKS